MNGNITYVEPDATEWFEFRPGSRWQILFEDPSTGQRAVLVEWEPGYSNGGRGPSRARRGCLCSRRHIRAGSARVRSGPGTYIHHWAGSQHQASTPDGCKFLEIVTGHPERSGAVNEDQLEWFRSLVTCSPTNR